MNSIQKMPHLTSTTHIPAYFQVAFVHSGIPLVNSSILLSKQLRARTAVIVIQPTISIEQTHNKQTIRLTALSIMSNNSGDLGRSSGIRNRASPRSDISRAPTIRHPDLVEINLEFMDAMVLGRQVSSNAATRVESDHDVPRSDQPRWKKACKAISRPFIHSYRVTKHILGQEGDGKVGWKRTTFILLTEQVGLALGLAPFVYNQLGYVGATFVCITVAVLAFYTNMILFKFKKDNIALTSICELAAKLLGNLGRIITLTFLTLCSAVSPLNLNCQSRVW